MICVVNKRLNFFANGKHPQSEISNNFQCLKLFSRCLQHSNNLLIQFNSTYHTRRRFISLLTIISTTSLQTINHIKSFQQLVNIINKVISLQTACWDSIKQFTNSKQDVNQSFTRDWLNYVKNKQSELASLIQSK